MQVFSKFAVNEPLGKLVPVTADASVYAMYNLNLNLHTYVKAF